MLSPHKTYSRKVDPALRIENLRGQEIKYTWAYPPQSFNSRHVDSDKSLPHFDSSGIMVNKERLPYWKPAERFIVNLEDYQNLLRQIETEEHTVYCKYCGLELIKFLTEKGMVGLEDGILGLRYTQHLMSYRPRTDGALGLECVCGETDTRISEAEKKAQPEKYANVVKTTTKEEAIFNSKDSLLVTAIVDKPIINRKEKSA